MLRAGYVEATFFGRSALFWSKYDPPANDFFEFLMAYKWTIKQKQKKNMAREWRIHYKKK